MNTNVSVCDCPTKRVSIAILFILLQSISQLNHKKGTFHLQLLWIAKLSIPIQCGQMNIVRCSVGRSNSKNCFALFVMFGNNYFKACLIYVKADKASVYVCAHG